MEDIPLSDLAPKEPTPAAIREQERQLESLKNRATIPLLEVFAEEIAHRAESGELAQEAHGMKLSTLINNLTKILTALQRKAPVIVPIIPAPGDSKDPSWYRANSALTRSDEERRRQRDAVEAEIVKEKP